MKHVKLPEPIGASATCTDPKHSQCVIKERIAKGDAGQNLIPFQIALEERAVTHLCEEIENLTERPKDIHR
jgi:hypothetical protein